MSSVLTPYLVSLEQLRQAVGSRDEPLIAAVLNSARQERDRLERNDEPEHRTEDVDPALRQLVIEHLRQAGLIVEDLHSARQERNDEPGHCDKDVERALRQLVMGEHLDEVASDCLPASEPGWKTGRSRTGGAWNKSYRAG